MALSASSPTTRFDWNEHQQGMVLGAFFWLYWSTQVPGGVLARRYGTKLVFGLGNLVPALLAFAIPAASKTHYGALLFIRLAQGCISVSHAPTYPNPTQPFLFKLHCKKKSPII